MNEKDHGLARASAVKFVILLGVVSLCADVTYEGARSITGPYLSLLGASATVVGIVAGFGELIGYGLRLLSGYLADRTGRYWTITLLGYAVNLLAVPCLAVAGKWQLAVLLMMTERVGKAIRTPARDVMLSHATHLTGRGWGFGLHEAMDQIGAVLGPLAIAGALYFTNSYQTAFAMLLIPAMLALAMLVTARLLYPRPRDFEIAAPKLESKGFPRAFWFYLAAILLCAAGYADFPLIAFHFKKVSVASDQWIPILYAIAMGVDGLAALVLGRLFDRFGISVLAITFFLSSFFAPLVFLRNLHGIIFGMLLWGIGMGAQESIMRAAIAEMVPANRRGSAYGLFNAGYGVFWFLGSALMGILYDVALPALIAFSVATQLAAVLLLLLVRRSQ